jgi:hypothetical protein
MSKLIARRTPTPAGLLDLTAEQLFARYPEEPQVAAIELERHISKNKEKYQKLWRKRRIRVFDLLEAAKRRILKANEGGECER